MDIIQFFWNWNWLLHYTNSEMLHRVLSTQECIYGRAIIKMTDVEQMTTIMMETKTLATVVDGHCLAAWSTFWCIMLEIERERERIWKVLCWYVVSCCWGKTGHAPLQSCPRSLSFKFKEPQHFMVLSTRSFEHTTHTGFCLHQDRLLLLLHPSFEAAGWGFVEWWNFVATKLSKCRPGSVGCSLG